MHGKAWPILRLPVRPATKCFLFAWIPAWGASLLLASGMFAALQLVAPAAGCGLACTFPVMDAIPPRAKLAFGGLLGGLMWLSRRRRPLTLAALMIRDVVSGAAAAVLVLALLPGGFGVLFLDVASRPAPNALYVFGAALGGMLGALLESACRRRLIDP